MIKSIASIFTFAAGSPAVNGKIFHASRTCPECGSKLCADAAAPDSWLCPNLDCPPQLRARIEHWCSPDAMDIAGGDAALVALLVGKGLAYDVAELYRIKLTELAALPGMNPDSARKFFDALAASRPREAWRCLYGLDIPLVGPAEAQSLCRQFGSVDNVFAAGIERLQQAKGVNEATARSLVHWHSDSVNRRLIQRLFKAGVNFKDTPPPARAG